MLRAFAYLALGWALLAVVGGLADVLGLTVMLPAVSAVLVAHVAFSRNLSVPLSLAVAIALGYLEDLHTGSPVGTMALAHGLALLTLRWASARFALGGLVMRAVASLVAVLLIDGFALATLLTFAEALRVGRDALLASVLDLRWQALATALVAPPVWALTDRILTVLRLDDRPPAHLNLGGGA